jgi:hypothetical protein
VQRALHARAKIITQRNHPIINTTGHRPQPTFHIVSIVFRIDVDVFSYFAYYTTRVYVPRWSTLPLAAYSALLRVVTIRRALSIRSTHLTGPSDHTREKGNNLKTLTLRASPHQLNRMQTVFKDLMAKFATHRAK